MSSISSLPAGPSAEPVSLLSTLTVRPWPDPVIDVLGHDPRSLYVEWFWLGILGPSTTWLMRRLAAGLEASPDGFELDLAETATSLGLGSKGGRHSPFMRSLARCASFELAEFDNDGSLAVRRKVPPLTRRQVMRLPASMQAAHEAWNQAALATPAAEQQQRRCRRLALSLAQLGDDTEAVERQLLRWKFHPALCRESAAWADYQQRQAVAEG